MTDVPYSWVVYIQLRWADGTIPTNQQISQIRAYETYGDTKTDLCAAGIKEGGNGICELNFGRESFYPPRETPTLTIEVYDSVYTLIFTSDELTGVTNLSTIEVVISTSTEIWRVSGTVTDTSGNPFTQGTVTAVDTYHDPDIELGSVSLNGGNTYAITYSGTSFGQNGDHTSPNLEVKVVDAGGVLVGSAGTASPTQNQTLNVVVSSTSEIWNITGTVLNADGSPFSGGIIKAVDTRDNSNVIITDGTTGPSGGFAIWFTKDQFQVNGATHDAPDLQIWVYDSSETRLLGASAKYPSVAHAANIDVQLPSSSTGDEYSVCGTVTNKLGLPVEGIEVRAVHMGCLDEALGETFLGSAISDRQGNYCIYYDPQTISFGDGPCCTPEGQINLIVTAVEMVEEEGKDVLVILASSGLLFNVSQNAVVNLTIDKISVSTDSEYTRLKEAISPCVGDPPDLTKLEGLEESSDRLRFIACQIKWSTDYVSSFSKAHIINAEIHADMAALSNPYGFSGNFPVEVLYALIRENLGDSLAAFLEVTPTTVYSAVSSAILSQTIASSFQNSLDSIMSDWRAIVQALTTYSSEPNYDSWQKKLLTLAVHGKEDLLLSIFFDVDGNLADFYAALEASSEISDSQLLDIIFVFEAYDLVSRWFELVDNLVFFKTPNNWERIEDLAVIGIEDRADSHDPTVTIRGWKFYINGALSHTIGRVIPDDLPPGTEEERVEIFAKRLFNKFGARLPQERFVTGLSENDTLDTTMSLARDFLAQYSHDDLDRDNITSFSESNEIDPDEPTREAIKATQRLYKLTTDPSALVGLHNAGFDSAFKISNMEEGRFVSTYEKEVGGLTAATRIHRAASSLASEILFYLGKFHQSVNATGTGDALQDPAALPAAGGGEASNGISSYQTMPNWITLFGDLNRCSSEHCETVFSPAAYFVDLLEFIGGGAKSVLFDRRPDLTEIELTCPNTNRLLPYIDLVNEVLENTITPLAFEMEDIDGLALVTKDDGNRPVDMSWPVVVELLDKGYEITSEATARSVTYNATSAPTSWVIEDVAPWRFRIVDREGYQGTNELRYLVRPVPQTTGGTESLEVYPEHINASAYDSVLSKALFPFNLPLDLAKEEIALILNHKGTPYHRIQETLTIGSFKEKLEQKVNALAYLNLSQDEADVIGHTKTDGVGGLSIEEWKYWGFPEYYMTNIPRPDKPTETVSGDWVLIMSKMPFFMHRSGLTYEQVLDVIDTEFANGGNPAASRLKIKYNEQAQQLCNINEYEIENLGTHALERMSVLVRLWKKVGWDIRELDQFLMDFSPTVGHVDFVALHHIQRLRNTLVVPVKSLLAWWRPMDTKRSARIAKSLFDEVFLVGNKDEVQYKNLELLRTGEILSIDLTDPEIDYEPTLRAALGVSPEEYLLLLKKRTTLGIVELSEMYAVSTAARAFGISIEEYDILTAVMGDAFVPVKHELFEEKWTGLPLDAIVANQSVDLLNHSGLSVPVLDYLLRHQRKEGDAFVPTLEMKGRLALTLNQAMQQIDESLSEDRIVNADALNAELSFVLPADQVPLAMKIIEGPAEGESAAVTTSVELRKRLSEYVEKERLDDAIVVIEGPSESGQVVPEYYAFIRDHFSLFFPVGTTEAPTPEEDQLVQYNSRIGTDEYTRTDDINDRYRLVLRYLDLAFLRIHFASFMDCGSILEPSEAALDLVNFNPQVGVDLSRAEDLNQRYASIWRVLLPHLRSMRKFLAVRDSLSQVFGLDTSLTSGLLEAPATDEAPVHGAELSSTLDDNESSATEWKQIIEGGWMRSGYHSDGTPSGNPRTLDAELNLVFTPDSEIVEWRSYLCPREDGIYKFSTSADTTPENIVLKINGTPLSLGEGIVLKADEAYEILLACDVSVGDDETTVRLLWTHSADAPVTIPQRKTIPADDPAYTRFHKAVLLIENLALDTNAIHYLTAPRPDNPILDFNLIPIQAASDAELPWDDFSKVLDAVSLNRSLGLRKGSGFELLLSFAESEDFNDSIVIDEEEIPIFDVLEAQTGWAGAEVKSVITILGLNHPDDVFEWCAIKAAMDVATRLKVPVDKVDAWLLGDGEPTLLEARNLRNALKSQYSSKVWKDVFKPLRDPLRQKQRDALVGYLTSNPKDENGDDLIPLCFTEKDLYSHFLIDTEMEPDVLTSRIKLALSAVQLFVHRVFLGYEPQAALPENAEEQWQWIKNYRVWEANRKVFLYPENWIEPELRDDKSEAFLELENELLQDDTTDERAERALRNFLENVSELSNLEVVGSYREGIYDDKLDAVLHVFAKTKSDTRTYYYRKYLERKYNAGYWTPWMKVDLEIGSDVVLPVVFNSRLFLVWPMFQETQKVVSLGSESSQSQYFTEIRFCWSEFEDTANKWKKPRISKNALYAPSFGPVGRAPGNDKPNGSIYSFQVTVSAADFFTISIYQNEFIPDVDEYTRNMFILALAQQLQLEESNNIDPLSTDPLSDHWASGAYSNGEEYWTDPEVLEEAERLALEDAIKKGHYTQTTREIGKTHIWRDNSDTKQDGSFETVVMSFPTGTKLIHNSAIETTLQINKRRSNGRLLYPENNLIFGNTPGNFRLVSTNFDFESRNNHPFFYQTFARTFFGEHLLADYVGGLSTQNLEIFRFDTFDHPLVREFQRRLAVSGLPGLMNRLTQALPLADDRYYGGSYFSNYYYGNYYGYIYLGYHIANDTQAWDVAQNMFTLEHNPDLAHVAQDYPLPTVDFRYGSSQGIYNWELFFHAPLLIADRLRQNRQYADAMKWFHYIFNPGRTFEDYELTRKWVDDLPSGCKYWTFLPFFANQDATKSLQDVMGLNGFEDSEESELQNLLQAWKEDPFKPHLIARSRIVAYQKTVVMKYLDNLIEWADQLFRQDSIESINEATQLYMVAAEILGERPEKVKCDAERVKYTYSELADNGLDDFSNAAVEMENVLNGNRQNRDNTAGDHNGGTKNLTLKMFYFSVPMNEKLLSYFDTVQDRLFKIRNSMNIDGIKRQLPLFQPPIDPALLVKAAAAGIDLGSLLQQMNAPMPHYRFSIWIQKAVDLAKEVSSFGAAVLSAVEKRDAEDLSQLRSVHEIRMLEIAREVKKQQISDAENAIEALQKSKVMAETRRDFYRNREKISKTELNQRNLLKDAGRQDTIANHLRTTGGFLGLIPQFHATFPPDIELGGVQLSGILHSSAQAVSTIATSKRNDANITGITAGYERRTEDWTHQADLADKEIRQIEQQILGAEIRLQIAERELDNHDVQTEQSQETLAFMKDKFTNRELYHWMLRELSSLYSRMYKLAYDVAKTAERTYSFELGIDKVSFIEFSYLDSLRKDLLAGEKLIADLKRMEIAYIQNNKREFEITKPISLTALDEYALQTLRETGTCTFEVPEIVFDVDFPGQYFRRIRNIALTIPCVTGPNTNISAKLTLLSNSVRTTNVVGGDPYAYQGLVDPRFANDLIGIKSIATSNGQNDSGMFELNFRDDRYLPFEGAGAVSRWRLELPSKAPTFDYSTISDVVLNMSYTSRDGGEVLKEAAESEIEYALNRILKIYSSDPTGLCRAVSLKREFPDLLHTLKKGTDPTVLGLTTQHFPYIIRNKFTMELPTELDQKFVVQTRSPFSTIPSAGIEIDETSAEINWSATEPFHQGTFTPASSKEQPWEFTLALTGEDASTLGEAVEDVVLFLNYTIN